MVFSIYGCTYFRIMSCRNISIKMNIPDNATIKDTFSYLFQLSNASFVLLHHPTQRISNKDLSLYSVRDCAYLRISYLIKQKRTCPMFCVFKLIIW